MTGSAPAIEQHVDDLLCEGAEGALQRERSAFDQAVGSVQGSLVLFGAGRLGRTALAALRANGSEPLAFCDNNQQLWGSQVEGVPVLSPSEAAAQFGLSAAFVVAIWGVQTRDRMNDRVDQLRRLGCRVIVPFCKLFWKYGDRLLPYHVIDQPSKVHAEASGIRAAAGLWADDLSRQEYVAQLRWRLLGDFSALTDHDMPGTYFPSGLIALHEREVFVDCGSYDGDTVAKFLELSHGKFERIVAFEPDPQNMRRLNEFVGGLDVAQRRSIQCLQKAVGATDGVVRFTALGTDGSAISEDGSEIECVSLDAIFEGGAAPTFLKMDIEGAELDALAGSRRVIAQHAPVLAICSYHKQPDLWRIPNLIHSFNPAYRLYLRPHLADGWDLVCYAIPEWRTRS